MAYTFSNRFEKSTRSFGGACSSAVVALVIGCFAANGFATPARTPAPGELPLLSAVSIDGITWTFGKAVPVGTFVNGNYYVVGPVTVTGISPAPAHDRNGSVLNLPPDQDHSPFDSRVQSGRYQASMRANPPISMKPGDALISSISVDSFLEFPAWLRNKDMDDKSPVRSVSVLTCLAQPVPLDAFRPSYCDRQQRIYRAGNLHRELLTNLPRVAGAPSISDWARHFRRPWLDVCFFGFDAAVEYQPSYGREVGRAVGQATLLLLSNFTPVEKESLLVNFVQYGIDLWGIVTDGYPGWQAYGGHASGRKWPIVFAGIMLGDSDMRMPEESFRTFGSART